MQSKTLKQVNPIIHLIQLTRCVIFVTLFAIGMSVTKESDHEEKDRLLPSAICHFRQLSHLLSENSNTKRNYTDSNVACVACGFGRFFFVSKIHFTFAT